MKKSALVHLITEVLSELEANDPVWAEYIVEELKKVVGGHYREDYFVKASDSLIVYLNACRINAVMVKPNQHLLASVGQSPNATYHLVLRMSDGQSVDFDELSPKEIKKQVSAHL